MKDIITSLIEHSKERISQPFFGAFLFCFCSYNWKFLYFILISSGEISTKITYAETHYMNGLWSVLIPIFIALLLMYLPLIINSHRQIFVDSLNNKREIKYYQIKTQSSKYQLDRAKNIALMEKQTLFVEREFEENIEKIKSENFELKEKNDDLNRELEKIQENLHKTMKQINNQNNIINNKDTSINELNNNIKKLQNSNLSIANERDTLTTRLAELNLIYNTERTNSIFNNTANKSPIQNHAEKFKQNVS